MFRQEEVEYVARFRFHKGPITSVEWCPQEASMLVTSGADHQVRDGLRVAYKCQSSANQVTSKWQLSRLLDRCDVAQHKLEVQRSSLSFT